MLLGDWRKPGFLFVLLLTAVAGLASAQCPQNDGQVTGGLKTYPGASDRYAVQYSINGGASTTAMVYISYYGQSTGSPYANVSGYTAGTTSMSFTSIPALPECVGATTRHQAVRHALSSERPGERTAQRQAKSASRRTATGPCQFPHPRRVTSRESSLSCGGIAARTAAARIRTSSMGPLRQRLRGHQ